MHKYSPRNTVNKNIIEFIIIQVLVNSDSLNIQLIIQWRKNNDITKSNTLLPFTTMNI